MLLFTPSVAATFCSVVQINKRKKYYQKSLLKKENKVMSEPSLFSGKEDDQELYLLNEIPQQQQQIQSLIDLHKIPGELWLASKRIDNEVKEQKKQREMITNVQERLAQYRLEKTKNLKFRLPRSHSPPLFSERFSPTILPERPSTSDKRQQIFENDEFIIKNIFYEEEQNNQPERQFRNRLSALEQQMERLNLFTAQTISSKILNNNKNKKEEEEIKKIKLKEIIQEFYKLKKNINKLRENIKLELNEINSQLNQKMRILIRQLKREIILNKRILLDDFEKTKEKEINILQIENQKLISSNEDAENRVESAENRLKEIFERINSLPFLNISSISSSDSINNLIISIRSAIDRSALNERKRGESSLEAYRAQANDELINERLKNERELKNIEKESKLLFERKESEWTVERNKLINELEKVKTDKSIEIAKIEENIKLIESDKIKIMEEQINILNKEFIDEKNKLIKELNQNNEKYKIEINEYKLNINNLKTKLLLEQKENQKSQILINELKEIKSALNEELIEASDRLLSVESQLAIACQNTEETATKLKRERRELNNKLADNEIEMEIIKEQLKASELRLKKEREDWIADAERSDKDWKAQSRLITKTETQKKELIKSLDFANSRLTELERKSDSKIQKEQILRNELLKLKEELTEERIQNENIIKGKEKEFKKELEKLKLELFEHSNKLTLTIENETELNIKLEDAEYRLKKASELCQKLSAELDELSEKSFNQSTSSEKLLADLEETKGELIIYRGSLEEQKRRNIQLETEIRQMEKERIRIENIFEKRLKAENEQLKIIEEKRIKEDNNNNNSNIEILIKKWEEKIFGKQQLFNCGELTKRIKIIFEYLLKISEQNILKINELKKENQFILSKLTIENEQIINQKEEISDRNEELKLLKLKIDQQTKNKIINENKEKEELLQRKRILERNLEKLEQILIIERTEHAIEIEKIKKELKEEQNCNKNKNNIEKYPLKTKETMTDNFNEEILENKKLTEKEINLKEKFENSKIENISLFKRLEIAEKRELELKILETTLRSELHEIRLKWRNSVKETENSQKELREFKITSQEMEIKLKRFEKEIIKLKGQIEALEMDRRRVDAIIKQTTLERNSLNKSLNTMERENSELQKHCRSLQIQLERLEKDGNEREEQINKRKIINLETELAKIGQQKKQLENLLIQKENNKETKISLLERRLEQRNSELEIERHRRK